MSGIVWRNETRRLGDLVPWEHNPKILTKKQADGLRVSLDKFGFAVPLLVSEDGELYDGHQRLSLMEAMKQYGPNATVDVRVSSRPLTEDERREFTVRLKQNQAGWDFDMLANEWDAGQLVEWGFTEWELGITSEQDPAKEWEGMPEFEQKDKTSYQSIHVHFKSAEEVAEFGRLIGQSLTNKTRSIWFTESEKMVDMSTRYVDG